MIHYNIKSIICIPNAKKGTGDIFFTCKILIVLLSTFIFYGYASFHHVSLQ